jgi:hypothetical protein
VAVKLSITDVRRHADLADYTGDLEATSIVRVTDRWNAVIPGGGSDAATVVDFAFPVRATCAATADPAIGSTCGVDTSFDAIVPNAIREGSRAVWQFGQFSVSDGGPDGDVETLPNTVFARQGVFVP